MDTSAEFSCPYCGEPNICPLDPSQGDESLVIDCEVCCRPMELTVSRHGDGESDIAVGLG